MDVYVRHSVMPVDEDQTHEFKGHRSISEEERNPRNYYVRPGHGQSKSYTRQSVSKYLCGMINSGKGGTIYLGVLDNGKVEGCMLTPFQQDHVLVSLRDTFKRYTPPVPGHMYGVRFVRVVDSIDEEVSAGSGGGDPSRRRGIGEGGQQDDKMPHLIRTHRYCWCDEDALALFNRGLISETYVIEISVAPWDPDDSRNAKLIQDKRLPSLCPCFAAEDGKAYLRRHASNECYESLEQMEAVTKQQLESGI